MLHGYLPAILDGLQTSLKVAATSLAIACVFGLLGATAKLSGPPWMRRLVDAYTTVIRGVPELALMLIVFYGGQTLVNWAVQKMGGDYVEVPAFAAGVLTIGFVFGAYMTETFRGAILAIPVGQLEAASAVGMNRVQVLQRITLPQMIRHAIPGFTNNWLVMIKATALVSIIGLDDMMQRAGLAAAATREPLTFYLTVAGIYLAITTVSIVLLGWVERRYSVGVRRAPTGL
ncbi:MAG: ABC transporter permease [Betaproteobacteria bacterium]|nr:MAG: ABC transporter permease [Betaproteobacteria bacterium]TAG48270.1 MAG: ABC transporter permease [Betaproteobacteria bacterium]